MIYKSLHQVDTIYFTKDGERTIPVMTGTETNGCNITQPDTCLDGNKALPWDSSGSVGNSGCWNFTSHSILCKHDISADTIHLSFSNENYSSTLGYIVESLNFEGDVVDTPLDIGPRNGLTATDVFNFICRGNSSFRTVQTKTV